MTVLEKRMSKKNFGLEKSGFSLFSSYTYIENAYRITESYTILTPTEALKVTSFTLTCAFSSNYAYCPCTRPRTFSVIGELILD